MKTEHIKEAINDYCQLDSPGYAIMINGPWGSGKTHFINELCEANDLKAIKTSLYGATTTDDITDSLFSSISSIEEFSEGKIEEAGNFIGKVTGIFAGNDNGSAAGAIAATIASSIKTRVLNNINKDRILIFDDFERSKLRQHLVLSVINTFVEHQGLKVIIVADESKISNQIYKDQKEKVVLHTYTIDRTPEEISTIVFKESESLPKFIQDRSKEEFTKSIELLNIRNLRTILFAFKCYTRIHQTLQDQGHTDKGQFFLTEFIFPCLGYALGFKEMKMEPKALEKISNDPTGIGVSYHLAQRKDKNEEKTIEDIFYLNVISKKPHSLKLKSVFNLICHGHLDYESLKYDIRTFKPNELSPKEKLIHWHNFTSEEEFTKCFSEVLKNLSTNEITFTSAHELASLCGCMHYIVKNDGYDINLHELEDILTKSVDYSIENKTYGNPEIRINQVDDDFIIDLINNLSEKVSSQKKSTKVEDLQSCIIRILRTDDLSKTHDEHAQLRNNVTTPIIDFGFLNELQDAIKEAKLEVIDDFNTLLKSRYESSNIFDFLGPEYPALEDLKVWLENYYQSLPKSFRRYNLSYVRRTLSQILENK